MHLFVGSHVGIPFFSFNCHTIKRLLFCHVTSFSLGGLLLAVRRPGGLGRTLLVRQVLGGAAASSDGRIETKKNTRRTSWRFSEQKVGKSDACPTFRTH